MEDASLRVNYGYHWKITPEIRRFTFINSRTLLLVSLMFKPPIPVILFHRLWFVWECLRLCRVDTSPMVWLSLLFCLCLSIVTTWPSGLQIIVNLLLLMTPSVWVRLLTVWNDSKVKSTKELKCGGSFKGRYPMSRSWIQEFWIQHNIIEQVREMNNSC